MLTAGVPFESPMAPPSRLIARHRPLRATIIRTYTIGAVLFALYLAMYATHALLSIAVDSRYLVDRQAAPPPLDEFLPAAIQNIVPRADGKLEIQLLVDVRDLLQQMDRLHGADVDELLLPRETTFVMHNPNLCRSTSALRLLIYVHSDPRNAHKRDVVRSTWGNARLFRSPFAKIVFLVGQPMIGAVQTLLTKEFALHGDIVQGDFRDVYTNLTMKALMGLQWIAKHCREAKFVLKSDDDAFVNIFAVIDLMKRYENASRTLACVHYPAGSMPILRYPTKCGRWCIGYRAFIGRHHYPEYCSGLAFLATRDLIPLLYEASRSTPYFWIDDVYITGLLPEKVTGIQYVRLNENLSMNGRDAHNQYTLARPGQRLTYVLAHGDSISNKLDMWEALLRMLGPDHAQSVAGDALFNASLLRQHYKTGALFVQRIF